jgi:hypothetical protein
MSDPDQTEAAKLEARVILARWIVPNGVSLSVTQIGTMFWPKHTIEASEPDEWGNVTVTAYREKV